MSANSTSRNYFQFFLNAILTIGLLAATAAFVTFGLYVLKTNTGLPLADQIRGLLALDSTQVWWYVTRASGIMGYLLIWFSMIWGFAVGSKIFDPWLERMFSYDFHEHLSWLGIAFVLLHVAVLLFDHFQPFTIWQVLFPFIAPYRPFWVGIGIITFYMTLLVTVTFYLRSAMSMQTFRKIHYLSIPAYLGSTLHGLFAGTDSPLLSVGMMYLVTFLITVFLFGYWLVMLYYKKTEERDKALQLALQRNKNRYKRNQSQRVTRRA